MRGGENVRLAREIFRGRGKDGGIEGKLIEERK